MRNICSYRTCFSLPDLPRSTCHSVWNDQPHELQHLHRINQRSVSLCGVTGVKQSLVQHIVSKFEEAYLTNIRNRTTNLINDTVSDLLPYLQDNYRQLMPHELLKCKVIVKKMSYHLRELITTVFSAVEELTKFSNITRTSYTQHQAVNISYVMIHRTGNLYYQFSNGITCRLC